MPKVRNKPGTIPTEKRLFIICEGAKNKSESAYFKSFILNCELPSEKVNVRVIDTDKNTGKELVQKAKSEKEFPNDIAWVVYDKDGYEKHPETFNLAKDNNIKIGFSVISFEFWILLHFEYTSKNFSKSDEIIKHLKKNHNFVYKKKSTDIFSETKSQLQKAKKHAKQIQKYQLNANPHGTPRYEFSAYTNLNELIEDIEKIKREFPIS